MSEFMVCRKYTNIHNCSSTVEIVAGAISMGLGGYLAGLSEIEHYDNERIREVHEVETVPLREEQEIAEIFEVSTWFLFMILY